MKFHEKLDFLMNITGTSNALISRKTNLDPSYISRLRRGNRNPIRERAVIEAMTSHFVKNACMDCQVDFLCEVTYPDYKAMDEADRIKLLTDWLIDGSSAIVDDLTPSNKEIALSTDEKSTHEEVHMIKNSIYFGSEGKKQATSRFLDKLNKCTSNHPILLFCDGDVSWLTEDDKFKDKVVDSLASAIKKSHHIIVIHNIDRSINDMLRAIELWSPIHFSNLSKTYYYPRIRDDLFKKTLFVIPQTAALVSNTVEKETESTACFLLEDEMAVKSFENEYQQLLRHCVPLLEQYGMKDKQKVLEIVSKYEQAENDVIYNLGNLSLMTLPGKLLKSILKRSKNVKRKYLDLHQEKQDTFLNKLQEEKYYEIIIKRKASDFEQENISLAHSVFIYGFPIYYKKEEYIDHLKNILNLAEKYKNFHFLIEEDHQDKILPVYIKKRKGAVLTNPTNPFVILHTEESRLTAAFSDYIRHNTALGTYKDQDEKDKAGQIVKLKDYIGELEKEY